MEELRVAEAADERSRPPDPEEVEAVAADALDLDAFFEYLEKMLTFYVINARH